MSLNDDDPAWFVFSAAWDLMRECYPEVRTINFIVDEVKKKLVKYEPDTKLIVGAVRFAVAFMFIDKVGRGRYRYHRTIGIRQGGYSPSDVTAGLLRSYASNSRHKPKRPKTAAGKD